MTLPITARFALREATSTQHDLVDRAFGGFALADPAGYRAFLRAQAEAYLPVEAGLDRHDAVNALPQWQDRRRSGALLADLHDMGEPTPARGDVPDYPSAEAALGALYVLEGSRLGGRMLARTVPGTLPRRFLEGGDRSLWRKLIEVVDVSLVSAPQLAVAIDAARAVFARFEASAYRHLKGL